MWTLAGEFKLLQELRRTLDQSVEDRRVATAKLSTAGAAEHTTSLLRLEALHKIELEIIKAKAHLPASRTSWRSIV